jgi:hypothetical protein
LWLGECGEHDTLVGLGGRGPGGFDLGQRQRQCGGGEGARGELVDQCGQFGDDGGGGDRSLPMIRGLAARSTNEARVISGPGIEPISNTVQ